jgi:alkylation response protein AidB-like acyl-CoA dehydrogenase
LKQLAQATGQWNEPTFREKYLQLNRDLEDHKALFEVFAARLRRGEDLGSGVSMLKVHQSEMFQRITDLMMEIAAERGALLEVEKKEVNAARLFLNARPATIYGGSSEIQRDILAKHFLGSSS